MGLLFFTTIQAQTNDQEAQLTYQLAQEAYDNNHFEKALQYLDKVEQLNSQAKVKSSYLKAKSYYRMSNIQSYEAALESISYYMSNGKDEEKLAELLKIKIYIQNSDDFNHTEKFTDGRSYYGIWDKKSSSPYKQGTMTWPDGNKYEGGWKEGRFDGQGTMTWPDGSKLIGVYLAGLKHGQFTKTWLDGRKEESIWLNDKLNGERKSYYKDGKLKDVGIFKDGKVDGEYKEYYENGSIWCHLEYREGKLWNCFSHYFPDGTPTGSTISGGKGVFIEMDEQGKKIGKTKYKSGVAVVNIPNIFGIKAGFNLPNIVLNDKGSNSSMSANESSFNANDQCLCFNIGIFAEFPQTKTFSFETGLFFTTKGVIKKTDLVASDYYLEQNLELYYIDIPLHAKVSFDGLYAIFGPYVGMGLSGKANNEFTDPQGKISYSESDIEFGSDKDFKKMDYGLDLGIGLEGKKVQWVFTYGWGLANIANSNDGVSLSNRVFSMSLGYKF